MLLDFVVEVQSHYGSLKNEAERDIQFSKDVFFFCTNMVPGNQATWVKEALAALVQAYHIQTSRNMEMKQLIARLHSRDNLSSVFKEPPLLPLGVKYEVLDDILAQVANFEAQNAIEVYEYDDAVEGHPAQAEEGAAAPTGPIQHAAVDPYQPVPLGHTHSRMYALRCDLCRWLCRPHSALRRHMIDRTERKTFRLVRMLPRQQMRWYAVDEEGNKYEGEILNVNSDAPLANGRYVPPPCGLTRPRLRMEPT